MHDLFSFLLVEHILSSTFHVLQQLYMSKSLCLSNYYNSDTWLCLSKAYEQQLERMICAKNINSHIHFCTFQMSYIYTFEI